MKIRSEDGLPFVAATVWYQGRQITSDRVILDTGSAGSVFAADWLAAIGLLPEPSDRVGRVSGVGGAEPVFIKQIDKLAVGGIELAMPDIQVAAMSYGISIDGIIGFDFLTQVEAVIDLHSMELRQHA